MPFKRRETGKWTLSLLLMMVATSAMAEMPASSRTVIVSSKIVISGSNQELFYTNPGSRIIDAFCTNLVTGKPFPDGCKTTLYRWHTRNDCNQKEGQPAILHMKDLKESVTLQNFRYRHGPNGLELANVGNSTLNQIHGEACEDALTVRQKRGRLLIMNSGFYQNPDESQRDKIVQVADANDGLIFRNVRFEGKEKCVRSQSGNKLIIENSKFVKCGWGIFAESLGRNYPGQGEKPGSVTTVSIDAKTKFSGNRVDLRLEGKNVKATCRGNNNRNLQKEVLDGAVTNCK